jgi:hypothetical protein
MGFLGRYLAGLCVAVLGLCAAGWLALTPVAFRYRGGHGSGWHGAALADRATGGGVAVVSALTLAAWVIAWRRRLRADGVLVGVSRRQARREARELRWREQCEREVKAGNEQANDAPDPAQVLSELRALLIPLLADSAAAQEPVPTPAPAPAPVPPVPVPDGFHPAPVFTPALPAPSGIAAIESMLAGTELAMVGSGEEETW